MRRIVLSELSRLLRRESTAGANERGGPFRNRDTEFAVVRAGLNYKFGSY